MGARKEVVQNLPCLFSGLFLFLSEELTSYFQVLDCLISPLYYLMHNICSCESYLFVYSGFPGDYQLQIKLVNSVDKDS